MSDVDRFRVDLRVTSLYLNWSGVGNGAAPISTTVVIATTRRADLTLAGRLRVMTRAGFVELLVRRVRHWIDRRTIRRFS